MLNRKMRDLAVIAITIVTATLLVALGATGSSATTTAAANAGHAQVAAASEVRPGHASAGCPDSMRVWVPSVSTVSASDPEAVAPPNVSAATRVAYGTHVAHLLAERKVHWLSTIDCNAGARSTTAAEQPAQYTGNWSGYASTAGHFTDASMRWAVPTITIPRAHVTTTVSVWPGIGTGHTSKDSLIQAGTTSDNISFGPFRINLKYLWWEIVPQNPFQIIIDNFPISTKDRMLVDVSYDAKSHNAMFLICYFSSNICGLQTAHVNGGSGNTAEWIVERNTIFGTPGYPPLSDFGNETITQAGAVQTANGVSVGNTIGGLRSYYPIIMRCNGVVLATPDPHVTSSGSFAVHWKNRGPSGQCRTT
jgi:hypothetical protein